MSTNSKEQKRHEKGFRAWISILATPPKLPSFKKKLGYLKYYFVNSRKAAPTSKSSFNGTKRLFRLIWKRPKSVPSPHKKQYLRNLLRIAKKPPSPANMKRSITRQSRHFWRFLLFSKAQATAPSPPGTKKRPVFNEFWKIFLRDLTNVELRIYHAAVAFSRNVWTHRKQVAIAILLFPFVLELFLQATTLLAFLFLPTGQPEAIRRGKTILCIGDAFTSGNLGITTIRPYPEYLAEAMVKNGLRDWRIRSYSSELMRSSHVVGQLPELVRREDPTLVYVMVGANDLLLDVPTGVNRKPNPSKTRRALYRDLFRTVLLYQQWKRDGQFPNLLTFLATPPAFLKSYKSSDLNRNERIISERKLSNLLAASRVKPVFPGNQTWYRFREQLSLNQDSARDGLFVDGNLIQEKLEEDRSVFLWQSDGGNLVLSGEIPDLISVLTPRQSPNSSWASPTKIWKRHTAWQRLMQGSPEIAQKMFTEFLREFPEDAFTHAGLAEAYSQLGLHRKAKAEIVFLQGLYKKNNDLITGRALVHAFPFENSAVDTGKLAAELIEKYPHDPWFWKSLAWSSFVSGWEDVAIASIDRAIEMVPPQFPMLKAEFLRASSNIRLSSNADDSLKDMLSAFVLDHRDDKLIEGLRVNADFQRQTSLERCMQDMRISEQDKASIRDLYQGTMDGSLLDRLIGFQRNLRGIARICREEQVKLVLVNYPFSTQSNLESITRDIAEEMDVSYLALNNRFEALFQTKGLKDKLLKDSSPTDLTSQYVADILLADVLYRIVTPPGLKN